MGARLGGQRRVDLPAHRRRAKRAGAAKCRHAHPVWQSPRRASAAWWLAPVREDLSRLLRVAAGGIETNEERDLVPPIHLRMRPRHAAETAWTGGWVSTPVRRGQTKWWR